MTPPAATKSKTKWRVKSRAKVPNNSQDATTSQTPVSVEKLAVARAVSLADVVRVRMMLQRLLPIELVEIVLHDAQYYSVVTSTQKQLIFHDDDREICTISLNERQRRCIQGISALIRGHDQGWSSYPEDRGTYRNSWTWYSLATSNARNGDAPRLATNRHADGTTQTHEFDWDRQSEVVRDVASSGMVALWAHARYPGWRNFIEEARLSVMLYPSLS
ncbi:hypothetical protein PsYK624_147260 [Phanerochaete sordida]|uniref:Uncharacterized protein n=1 Tax=Phanerochaete sordida TaxID=48140 RepID=A0A9P3GSC0_9APHY|nr:hypothetical protein PsYK624_147260 [Phanerochaete sordida]